MAVNENCNDISYVLGRLFSVLENIQLSANPGINSTIKDRYFNSACATPASVFPVLLKLANAHLGKLDQPREIYFKKKLGALTDKIAMPDTGTPLPHRLTLDEQGAFVLGYYQETQARYAGKRRKNKMAEAIHNRYDFVILFDVTNGNPNGDPDAGNLPRVDPETGLGLVTDVCLKRKIRNYVEAAKEGEPGYRIYIKENVPLEQSDKEALDYIGISDIKDVKKKDPEADVKIRNFMCSNFYDIRTFGAVMTTFVKGALNCGQVRGPVQIGFARSMDPIAPQEVTITRVAITTTKDAQNKATEMGRKFIVPYALYQAEGYVSANLARKTTGFSDEDLALLWKAIINMFENDHSAARGNMAVRELIVFRHDSELGNAPSYKLFERIHVQKKDAGRVPRSYDDYEVTVDTDNLPQGVTCQRMI